MLDVYSPKNAPPAGTKYPAIIFIHGGGFYEGDKNMWTWHSNKVMESGYVAFSINYRLTRNEKNTYPAAVDDCQRAVRWVRANAEKYHVDPDRIGAVGGSVGGTLVAMLGLCDTRVKTVDDLSSYSSRVQCVVSYYGTMDLTPAQNPNPFVKEKMGDYVGKKYDETSKESYVEASPISHVDKNAPPFLLILGTKDKLVPQPQNELLLQELKKYQPDATFMKFEGEGHGFHNITDSDDSKKAWDASMAFLNRILKNQPAPGAPGNP
jgi:acetyl esterase/lipase